METDERFTHVANDPKFRNIPRREKKVKIDKRFQSMFNDSRFKVDYKVDKRGKPLTQTTSEDLRRYYELTSDQSSESSENEEKEEQNARTPRKKKGKKILNKKTERSEIAENAVEISAKKEGAVKSKVSNDLLTKIIEIKEKKKKPQTSANAEDELESTDETSDSNESDDVSDSNLDMIEDYSAINLPDNIKKKLRSSKFNIGREEGAFLTSSSSEGESDESSDNEEIVHDWGELDKDAVRLEEATKCLALCNMDWDRVKAVDIMVLMNSFLPTGGVIHKVTVYPSEYGIKKMKEDDTVGPQELASNKLPSDDEDDDEKEHEDHDEEQMERIRKYQLSRLKYYYAVIECDSVGTASKIYEECDGTEYESSAAVIDLRFIPDGETFEQDPRDECTKVPELSDYAPRLFVNTALQQSKVDLTWDETDPDRVKLTEQIFDGKSTLMEEDINAYLASESDDEEEEGDDNDIETYSRISSVEKYRALLEDIEEKEKSIKKKNDQMSMEVTWEIGLKDKTKELVDKKMNEKKIHGPWDTYLDRVKDKKKQKQKLNKKNKKMEEGDLSEDGYSDDDIPSDIDMEDEFFKEELSERKQAMNMKNKKKYNVKTHEELLAEEKEKASLELLLMDDAKEESKNHFSLDKMLEENKRKKKKGKKIEDKLANQVENNFQLNLSDPRFTAMYSSAAFNVDPSNPSFKKTKGMESIVTEKQKRHSTQGQTEVPAKQPHLETKPSTSSELSSLVNKIKQSAQMFKQRKIRR